MSTQNIKNAVESFQHFVSTYSNQPCYESYSNSTYILDMLYGIGISLDKEKYKFAGRFGS